MIDAESSAQQAADTAASGIALPPPQSMDTMRDLVAGMAFSFDPRAAGGLEAVIQFDVSGDTPGRYYLDIARGRCAAYEGEYPRPRLTIHTPAKVWMAISQGKMNGAAAMMTGRYTASGDLGLLMRFGKLFPRPGKR